MTEAELTRRCLDALERYNAPHILRHDHPRCPSCERIVHRIAFERHAETCEALRNALRKEG